MLPPRYEKPWTVDRLVDALQTWHQWPGFTGETCSCGITANVLNEKPWFCSCGRDNLLDRHNTRKTHTTPDLGPSLGLINAGHELFMAKGTGTRAEFFRANRPPERTDRRGAVHATRQKRALKFNPEAAE